jgi:hypothetical protein
MVRDDRKATGDFVFLTETLPVDPEQPVGVGRTLSVLFSVGYVPKGPCSVGKVGPKQRTLT